MLTPRPTPVLALEARRSLDLSREEFGRLMKSSKRTVARWEGGQSAIHAPDLLDLARHLYPNDPALAEEIALAGGATLERLGIVPPSPALPPPPPPIPGSVLADSILCATADVLKAVPETVRAAVLAAFRRARELRMTVEDVEKALTKR